MKTRLLFIIILLSAISALPTPSRANDSQPFPYPTAPDTMLTLQPRCDYIVSHFWDRCDFGRAVREPAIVNTAFGDWISIMQHATADTVYNSINQLLTRFQKKGDETLLLAQTAENWLYSDTSAISSEELYLPFARAAAEHKKISRADKARFQLHRQIIESSGIGATLPNLEFERPDGSKGRLNDIVNSSILLFINDPDCDDCNLARVRLSADFNANQLIESGELAIVSIYPEEASTAWKSMATTYPTNWTVCAIEDADNYFDLRHSPKFIFLNSRHKVLVKDVELDYLLAAFRIANEAQRMSRRHSTVNTPNDLTHPIDSISE